MRRCLRAQVALGWGGEWSWRRAACAASKQRGCLGMCWLSAGTFGSAGRQSGRALEWRHWRRCAVGAGLVTGGLFPRRPLAVVSSIAPELMTWALEARRGGDASSGREPGAGIAWAAGWQARRCGDRAGAGAVGGDGESFTTGLLAATKIPAVIDADALNILAGKPGAAGETGQGTHAGADAASGEMGG